MAAPGEPKPTAIPNTIPSPSSSKNASKSSPLPPKKSVQQLPRKKVSFQQDSKDPRKIKVHGAGNADVYIFVGLIALILISSLTTFENVGGPVIEKETDRQILNRESEALRNVPFREDKCGLYLAESSVDETRLGVFAGQFIPEDYVLSEAGAAFLINKDVQGLPHLYDPTDIQQGISNPPILAPQLRMMMKWHPLISNVKGGEVECDPTLVDTSSCQTAAFKSSRVIAAGEELFSNHGYHDSKAFTDVDYNVLDDIVKDMMIASRGKNRFGSQKGKGGFKGSTFQLIRKTLSRLNETLASLLPQTQEDLREFASHGSAFQTLKNHSISWLETNGKCLDNVRPGVSPSGLNQQGAIATRFIPEGGLIIPTPLLFIKDGSPNTQGVEEQLLINHCFGHAESSVLLCPMNFASLINHGSASGDSSTEGCTAGPNAIYQWSAWNSLNAQSHDSSIDDLGQEYGQGLSFDIIATRDIQSGEEIFMDYGKKWEDAWNEHLKGDSAIFWHAIDINDDIFPPRWKNR